MKKNLLSKLITLCALAFVGGTLASCQTINKEDAKVVIVKESEANIYVDAKDGKRYATATIGVQNNSIYDVYTWDLTYTMSNGTESATETATVNMYVAHGAAGYVTFLEEVQEPSITSVKIISGAPRESLGVMKTYLGWWIAGFAVLLCSVMFFAFKLFQETFTKEQAKEVLREHIGGAAFGGLLILLLVMFPLILGSWVPTAILGGALAGSIVISAILTGIKALVSKN